MLINGDCLIESKKLPDKSVDFFYLDLPYGETNCIINSTTLYHEVNSFSSNNKNNQN